MQHLLVHWFGDDSAGGSNVWRWAAKNRAGAEFRVAIAARTTRHKHAAIHARWTPNGDTVLYGFHKISGKWKCVAGSDERLRGAIRFNA